MSFLVLEPVESMSCEQVTDAHAAPASLTERTDIE